MTFFALLLQTFDVYGIKHGSLSQPSPLMAAGAAGVHGHPAAEDPRQGPDSVTTQHPAMKA